LKNILTSTRISPDHARQVRIWSGDVRDGEDGTKGLTEILPIYTPEKQGLVSDQPAAFEGADDDFDMRWEVHNAAWSSSVPRFDVRDRLSEITVPTLVVVGRHDPICPVEDSEELHSGIKGSELAIFAESGHNPASDEPAAFRSIISTFLYRLI
jgi:proline iminopeptidase